MAYTMTHILIAEKVSEYFDTPVNYDTYMLGAIAPDSVHAYKDYVPSMKERAHLLPMDLRWGKITTGDQFERWLASAMDFYISNQNVYEKDFLLGYIVHILTDIFSCKMFFAPFSLSVTGDYEEAMEAFRKESFNINYCFYLEYSKRKNLSDLFTKGHAYSIPNVFDASILPLREKQVFEFELSNRDITSLGDNSIVTLDGMNALINSIPLMIKKQLTELLK